MKKFTGVLLLTLPLLLGLTGCSSIGDKAASITTVYCTTAVLSLLIVAGYCWLVRKKDLWHLLLFSSIFVVNAGYLSLALSRALEEALLANRLSYLGSVFLPLSMLMIILRTCRLKYPRALPGILAGIGIGVFLVAASPGYLDIYYKEVSLTVVNGMSVLEKVYGPWHDLYLFYLLGYFTATAGTIVYVCLKKSSEYTIPVVFLGSAVFVNMGVWLLEQLVRIDFELLSVSYIVSELFLLILCLMLQERSQSLPEEAAPEALPDIAEEDVPFVSEESKEVPAVSEPQDTRTYEEQCAYFAAQRLSLTPTEHTIYDFYLAGKTTKEIMAELNIKENTLKYHNKNIYSKLGVSSRKQLMKIAATLAENPMTPE